MAFKSDPDEYGISNLKKDGQTAWTGIANPTARLHLRTVTPGDQILIYHTGKEKAIVGLAQAVSGPIPDPTAEDAKAVAVELRFTKEFAKQLSLTQIKADPAFANWDLVKQSRLSVVPVNEKNGPGLCSSRGNKDLWQELGQVLDDLLARPAVSHNVKCSWMDRRVLRRRPSDFSLQQRREQTSMARSGASATRVRPANGPSADRRSDRFLAGSGNASRVTFVSHVHPDPDASAA